jgi:hypothetical protein
MQKNEMNFPPVSGKKLILFISRLQNDSEGADSLVGAVLSL